VADERDAPPPAPRDAGRALPGGGGAAGGAVLDPPQPEGARAALGDSERALDEVATALARMG